MPSNSDLLFLYSSSSLSSSSSSSQLSTPSARQNGSSRAITKSHLWDVEKAKCSFGFSKPKSSEELKEEIADIETEILQLERSLVQKLEKVDPTSMAREEKLAFWINIHNALVMHAYILYGTGEDITSTKAAFNIGGEWGNVYDVQSSILGIRASHSPTRVWTLFSPAMSSKTSRSHTYALEYAEPLLHFALSTGKLTDPMVRVYTAEGILQELRQARDSFIQTSVRFEKETWILLPEIIYNYANDTSLDMAELFNTISGCLTETQRTKMRRAVKKKQDRCIHWIKHDSDFHYIIHWEYVRDSLGI